MKAKEYYEKYKAGLLSADDEKYLPAARGLISDLLNESKAVAEARHVRFDRGFIPVLREQIGKYKAVVRMFECLKKTMGRHRSGQTVLNRCLRNTFPACWKRREGRAARQEK